MLTCSKGNTSVQVSAIAPNAAYLSAGIDNKAVKRKRESRNADFNGTMAMYSGNNLVSSIMTISGRD